MYDDEQVVQVKWNNNNRDWFESKGYVFTKRYELFDVVVKDLNPTSKQRWQKNNTERLLSKLYWQEGK